MQRIDVRLVAVLVSLLVSLWVYWQTDVVNFDGVLYLETARMVSAGDWQAACSVSGVRCWLLYPALVSLVSGATLLDVEASAYLLNALLSALMVFTFITLVKDLGGNRRVLLFAALVILVHPYLNENRADVIRDHGYWAFYLLALLWFLRYRAHGHWQHAVAWALAAVVATLFRIEGAVFLLLLPLVLLVDRDVATGRWLKTVKAYAVQVVFGLCLVSVWLLYPEFASKYSGRLFEPLERIADLWWQLDSGLSERLDVLGERVLGRYLDHYAGLVLWAGLLAVLVKKIISTLGPLYSAFFLFKPMRDGFPARQVICPLTWLVILNMAVLSVELLTRFVLSGRFIMPLALTLMIIVPFMLDVLYTAWRSGRLQGFPRNLAVPVTLIALAWMGVDGVYSTSKSSKLHLREAGYWVRENIPRMADVYIDDARVAYYGRRAVQAGGEASRNETGQRLRERMLSQSDYIVLRVDSDRPGYLSRLEKRLGEPVKKFEGESGDTVYVFKP